jgi:hypothetical protein
MMKAAIYASYIWSHFFHFTFYVLLDFIIKNDMPSVHSSCNPLA